MFKEIKTEIRFLRIFSKKLRILCLLNLHSWGLDIDGYDRLRKEPTKFRKTHLPARCFRCETAGFMSSKEDKS